jgi:protein O-mannosyl-transferase
MDKRVLYRSRSVWICIALTALTLTAYWPVRHHDFVNYDDPDYVSENPHVQPGFSKAGVEWAFARAAGETTYWHPLTWLSHMLDCQLFGLRPGPHHLTNVCFHIANSLLLLLVLKRMTGALWRSATVAALFACHPLQVDSVAWIAERKNVLSAFFWMLTILAYVRYAGLQGRDTRGRIRSYLLTLVFFILGLMAKPVLVTLPFVLLLLDYWPLNRLEWPPRPSRLRKAVLLIVEKLPLFAFAAASVVITLIAHQRLGVITGLQQLPLGPRLENVLVSYVRYIGKTVWPADLAVFYPYSFVWPTWQVIGSAAFLLVVSVLVFRYGPRHPYLPTGWFWFVGTLVPVIGLIQAGVQSMADRFAYLPVIGLFIIFIWGLTELVASLRCRVPLLLTITFAALAACVAVTTSQLKYWRSADKLFEHAIAVTSNNYVAHNYLGLFLARQGRLSEAAPYFSSAISIKQDYAEAYNNLGKVFLLQTRLNEAFTNFYLATLLSPKNSEHQYNLGIALVGLGRPDAAAPHLLEAVRIKPDYTAAHLKLGSLLSRAGRLPEALNHYSAVVQIQPTNSAALVELGNICSAQGKAAEAVSYYAEALRIAPGSAQAHNNLGNVLTAEGKLEEAVAQYYEALRLKTNYANAHYNLGLARAKQGKFSEAVIQFDEVLRLDPADLAARYSLANTILKQGNTDEAAKRYTALLKQQPDYPEALAGMGNAMRTMGRLKEAIQYHRQALRLNPDLPEALQSLAWILATAPNTEFRNGPEAVELAGRATQLTQEKDPGMLDVLAAAYAESGRFPEAIATAKKAYELSSSLGQQALADAVKARQESYRSGRPHREP